MPRKPQRSGFGHWERNDSKPAKARGTATRDAAQQVERSAPILGPASRSPQAKRSDPADEVTRRTLQQVAQRRASRDRLLEPPLAGGHQPDKGPTRSALESMAAIQKAREAAGLLEQEERVWERVVRAAGPIINAHLATGQPLPAPDAKATRRPAPRTR